MFTPQLKGRAVWSAAPKSGTLKIGSGPETGYVENQNSNPRPPDSSAGKKKFFPFAEKSNAEPWLGDTPENRESLLHKIDKLEKELFDYQYNMGLLLIEKKEESAKFEELRCAYVDAEEALNHEREANSLAISDAEKREEHIMKILGVEKQCVQDLEKALHEMRSEHAEIKFSSESKLSEANALLASVEKKSLEIEEKMQIVDSRLAEATKIGIETEKKRLVVEAHEKEFQKKILSFSTEQEAKESALMKQREDLKQWDSKLQEGERSLDEGWRILNQREELANTNDKIFKDKECKLEKIEKEIVMRNLALKKREEDANSRLTKLSLKEKEVATTKNMLETKEIELRALEEKLIAREKDKLKKLEDEHNAFLEARKLEFELETEQKRNSVDQDLKVKLDELKRKETGILHLEEKVAKREQALENKMQKFKEKEKAFELKSNAQKELEKSIKAERKKLELEKKQMLSDNEKVLHLKDEIEKIRAEIVEQQAKICEETNQLRVTDKERAEFNHMQLELKEEIDSWRQRKEVILKEYEDLKQDRLNFEKQWEELDEKNARLKKELEEFNAQKEKLESSIRSEEKNLKMKKLETDEYLQRELKSLDLAKETFFASIEQEKSILAEKTQSENSRLLNDFEMRKSVLESGVQKRLEEIEKHQREKDEIFEDEKRKELNVINHLKQVAEREMDEMRAERLRLEHDREEAAANKKHLEEQQLEIQKDIDDLVLLSGKLKSQREDFIKERKRFITFVDNQKNCQSCGELVSDFVLSDINTEIENAETIHLQSLHDNQPGKGVLGMQNNERSRGSIGHGTPSPSKTFSLIKKCSAFFKLSPISKSLNIPAENSKSTSEAPQSSNAKSGPNSSSAIDNDSYNIHMLQFDNNPEEEAVQRRSIDEQNITDKVAEAISDSQQYDYDTQYDNEKTMRGKSRAASKQSSKAVVEEYKDRDHGDRNVKIQEEQCPVDNDLIKNLRKRNRASVFEAMPTDGIANDSEGLSDNVLKKPMKKRRQKTSPSVQVQESRYNLRRPKNQSTQKSSLNPSIPTNDKVEGVALPDSIEAPSRAANDVDADVHVQRETEPIIHAEITEERVTEYTELREEDFEEDDVSVETEDGTSQQTLDGDDESEKPGETSVGKKLWNFLTT